MATSNITPPLANTPAVLDKFEIAARRADQANKFIILIISVLGLVYYIVNEKANRYDAFSNARLRDLVTIESLSEKVYDGISKVKDSPAIADLKLKYVCERIRNSAIGKDRLKRYPLNWPFTSTTTPEHQAAEGEFNLEVEFVQGQLDRAQNLMIDGKLAELPQFKECRNQSKATAIAQEKTEIARKNADSKPGVVPAVADGEFADIKKQVEQGRDQLKAASPATPTGSLASITTTAGQRRGYAVDVFWCEGDADRSKRNFEQARNLASALGSAAKKSVEQDEAIGRVRLRILSIENQSNPLYLSSGFEIRAEQSEDRFAKYVNDKVIAPTLGQAFAVKRVETKYPYYVSVFVCGT